ncbi:MAG TPA: peptidoglycan-binding protein [Ktedonobacteraceae bacterium]|nr:peptidoglycan-binding protein [Ktedonobacteraceae bacterium]
MHRFKRPIMLGGILPVVCLFFAFIPMASPAFAATTGTHLASSVSTLTHTASAHLAPDVCPPSCANPINSCPPLQEEGNNNNWVRVIQFRLNVLIQAHLATDGVFGSVTKATVHDFQVGLDITDGGGAVGDRTWSAMGFCLGYSIIPHGLFGTTLTNCPPDQSEGSSGIFVQAIQALLNIEFHFGTFHNTPDNFHPFLAFDGQFGSNTKAAVIDFQQKAGISGGGGVVGQRTWSALGMCS